MGFLRGQASFTRLAVSKPTGAMVAEEHLDALAEGVFRASGGEIVVSEQEVGFVGGEHIYDERFSFEHNVYAGGAACHFGLRIDTNKVPSEIKRAVQSQHQTAMSAESATGFLSRAEKREMKELVEHALREELNTGKYRKSKLVPMLWDIERSAILSASGASTVIEALGSHWRATMSGGLSLQSAGALAYTYCASVGKTRDFEDLLPTPWTKAPGGESSSAQPDVPWAMGGGEPHDFLGNEFLVWLWHRCDIGDHEFELADGTVFGVLMDRVLECECAWGVTGKQSLSADAGAVSPARMVEASDALACGKWPRRVGLMIGIDDQAWTLTLQADKWMVSGCSLPKPEEGFENAREEGEWRIEAVRRIDGVLVGLYELFLSERLSGIWGGTRERITRWIAGRKPQRGGVTPRPAEFVEAKSEKMETVGLP
ncbi:MAG: hypothetical protein AAGB34_09735 [Planctomycetota bacterium]